MGDPVYILFYGEIYYPEGGMGDIYATFSAADDAEATRLAEERVTNRWQWWQLVRVRPGTDNAQSIRYWSVEGYGPEATIHAKEESLVIGHD